MAQSGVKNCGDGICSAPVCLVGKQVRVKAGGENNLLFDIVLAFYKIWKL